MTGKTECPCLCGAVTITARIPLPHIQACHCQQCRTWTGGSPLYCVRVEDAEVSGEDHIGLYRISAHGERGFCKSCGTTLFWRMQGAPVTSVAAGLVSHLQGLRVTEEIFTDRRADWQPPFADASQSTEAEEFAKLDAYLADKA